MPSAFTPLQPRRNGSVAGPVPAFTPMRVPAGGPGPGPANPSQPTGAAAFAGHHGPHDPRPGAGSKAASHEPVVTVQKDGDRVTGIRIECGCGQVIELACAY